MLTAFINNAHIPITNKMLNTAEPTIVPIPISVLDTNTPLNNKKNNQII